ncbi:MAG: HEPN domain-containing protein [Methanobrevibacter sp.]|nr:HEPN domain-containing protein [Candidatus Methanovirga procula]
MKEKVNLFINESLEEIGRLLFNEKKYNKTMCCAYYAIFYAVKALLAKKNIFPKTCN